MSWPYHWPWTSAHPGEEMGRGGISANDQREWIRRFGSAPAIEGDDTPSTTQEPTSITGGHGQWQQMADDDQFMDDAAFVILRLQESSQPNAAHEAFQRILAALKSELTPTTQEAEKARRKHAPRDGLDPDTVCELDCGHSAMVYNNLRSDPTGWQTWCYTCDASRTVTSARPWPKACRCPEGLLTHALNCPVHPGEPRTQEAEKALEPVLHRDADGFVTMDWPEGLRSTPIARELMEDFVEQANALRSLRTQHTALEREKEQWAEAANDERLRVIDLEAQHTKDQERIAELEREAAPLLLQQMKDQERIEELNDRIDALQLQHTIDVDEIRALRRGRDGEGSPRNRAVR